MASQFFIDKIFIDKRPHGGLTYEDYLLVMDQQANAPVSGLSAEEAEKVEYTRLNLHRSLRIGRTSFLSTEHMELLDGVSRDQLWMVLTEPWCGDSAQCLPFIAVLAAHNPRIKLRILPRDENLDIMDQYLTEGKRSIPLLVAFADDGAELFRWGPRPVEAQAIFTAAKTEGLDKSAVLERMHLWYGRNRGQALLVELAGLLAAQK